MKPEDKKRLEEIRAHRKMMRELEREDLGLIFTNEDFLLRLLDEERERETRLKSMLIRVYEDRYGKGDSIEEIASYYDLEPEVLQ